MGFSQHSGMVICCDGTEDADRRIERVLWNDPATGVMRHADAGYDIALDCAREHGLNLPGYPGMRAWERNPAEAGDDMSLERFVEAQARVWPAPLEEIRAGRKESHWMWFVFPQLRGLGRSATAQHYGLADLDEAKEYLAHDVLAPRLIEISRAMLAHEGNTPETILGPVDAMKLRSCGCE